MEVNSFDPSRIKFTEAAEKHLAEYVASSHALGIKLGLLASGCAGFSYDWNLVFEYIATEEPYLQKQNGFIFILDSKSADYLLGSTVDVVTVGPGGKMISITSPKQSAACGCGESVAFDG